MALPVVRNDVAYPKILSRMFYALPGGPEIRAGVELRESGIRADSLYQECTERVRHEGGEHRGYGERGVGVFREERDGEEERPLFGVDAGVHGEFYPTLLSLRVRGHGILRVCE